MRKNKKILKTWNGHDENKKIGNTQHAVTERWVGHGQPWLTSMPTTYTRGESPPSVTQVTGGESTSIWAGMPPEKALVRGAEGQSCMGSPWLFPSMQLLQLQLQQLQEVGSMAHTTLACSPQYRRAR